MMNKFALALVASALAAPTVSFAESPVWPAGAQDKNDERVLAFYAGMCANWADENGLAGGEREAYLAKCQADAPAVYPVGYAGGGDGGGGGDE
jgi:hypothetical protein